MTGAQYVYAVGAASALTELPGLAGIDGAPVSCAVVGRLCGLTSPVSVQAFQAAQQAPEVSETGWLAEAVRAHERVIVQALAGTAVLPMRFGTVYPGPAEVHAMLHRHQAALLAELDRLAGCTEWCLTVRPDDPDDTEPAGDPAPAASGTAWLLSRQAALHQRASRTDRLATLLDRLRTALAPQVRDLVVARSVNAGIVRIWLLADEAARLQAAVADLAAGIDGARLELTGPWPAYHFVRALQDEVGSDRVRSGGVRP